MTRKRRNNGFLIFFITLILLSLSSTFASNRVEFQGQTQPIITKPDPAPSPPSMLVEDMIVVKFKPTIDESAIESLKEGMPSGIPSIDALISKYQISKIWRQFPGSSPPQIPAQVDLSRIYAKLDDRLGIPDEYYLSTNFPNPFNLTTSIRFGIPVTGFVDLTVWDIYGRRVATIVSSTYSAGNHEVIWNAVDIPTGEFVISISTRNFSAARKAILIR